MKECDGRRFGFQKDSSGCDVEDRLEKVTGRSREAHAEVSVRVKARDGNWTQRSSRRGNELVRTQPLGLVPLVTLPSSLLSFTVASECLMPFLDSSHFCLLLLVNSYLSTRTQPKVPLFMPSSLEGFALPLLCVPTTFQHH